MNINSRVNESQHDYSFSCWLLLLAILLLYLSTANITKTVTVQTPTFDQYVQLYSKYAQTLTCPCTKIAINYDKFLRVNYTFHQVCSSSFVTEYWLNYLGNLHFISVDSWSDDFRIRGSSTFQALSAFCQLVNETIFNSLTQFYSNQYISLSITSSELFKSNGQLFFQQFILSTTNSFLSSLRMIRDTTQGNLLISSVQTNAYTYVDPDDWSVHMMTAVFSECNCGSSYACVEPSRIYSDTLGASIVFFVPSMYSGCYVIESLLQSTLECFYNQTCFDQLIFHLPVHPPSNITVLNSSLHSHFLMNSTIQELVNELMVEEWNSSIDYANYYNECHPTECIYTIETRNDALYIITTLIGLVGGSVTILKLAVPRFVRLIYYIRSKRTRVAAVTITVRTKVLGGCHDITAKDIGP